MDIIQKTKLADLICEKLDKKENLSRQELSSLGDLVDETDIDLNSRIKIASVLYSVTSSRLEHVKRLEKIYREKLLNLQHESSVKSAANDVARELLTMSETSLKDVLQHLINTRVK